jgi:hypothetical protein
MTEGLVRRGAVELDSHDIKHPKPKIQSLLSLKQNELPRQYLEGGKVAPP